MSRTLSPNKYAVIGRHKFTERQLELLRKAGLNEEAYREPLVNDFNTFFTKVKEMGINNVVIQALPLHLLPQAIQTAKRHDITLWMFKITALATVGMNEECPGEADIVVPDPRSGNKRCSRTESLMRLKNVKIEIEADEVK